MRVVRAVIALLAIGLAMPARAQTQSQPPEPGLQPLTPPVTRGEVRGRVFIPAKQRDLPVSQLMVTLHRVGADSAGPLDSMRTGADGRYHFSYRRFGSEDAVYFVGAIYRGIAYFSAPLQPGPVSGEDGDITVFDTTSGHVPFSVQGHHLVVSSPGPTGERTVVEVYEVSNDTTVTAVGRDSLTPVWSAPFPRGATNFTGGQGDVSPAALSLRDGRVILLSPFGPGVKQLSYRYTLAPGTFPFTLAVEHPTSVLEVLAEEDLARVSGASLRQVEAARTQGRVFRRFLGQDVPAGEEVRVDVPATSAATRTEWLVAIGLSLLLVMAGALAIALRRRRGGTPATAAAQAPSADALLAAIAALDARREAGDATLGDEEYAAQRSALKARATAAMAAEGRTP